ncbi:MAG: FHA domain-containing protein [Anaerolineales bacterium]|jgi:pSer/pThr/pTyr-binding forkhead associated (FHA) protein
MSIFSLTSPGREELPIEDKLLVGRGSECDVRLKDSEASRKHATFYLEDQSLYVRDEGSANGTYLNEERIDKPEPLSSGDQIRLGKTIFTVAVADVEDVTPTVFADDLQVEDLKEPAPPAEEPPAQRVPPVADGQVKDPSSGDKRSPLLFVGIGCAVLAVIAFCGLLALFAVNQFDLFGGLFDDFNLFPEGVPEYSLDEILAEDTVDDRPDVVSYLGRPDAFTISELMLEGTPVRVETWRYFAFGTRVDFVDGEATWTMDIEPAPEDSILPAWYDPLAFELGMSQSQAAQVAASASPAGMSPEMVSLADAGEEFAGGIMLVGDQIILGLDETGLIYVETIGLFPEGEGGS